MVWSRRLGAHGRSAIVRAVAPSEDAAVERKTSDCITQWGCSLWFWVQEYGQTQTEPQSPCLERRGGLQERVENRKEMQSCKVTWNDDTGLPSRALPPTWWMVSRFSTHSVNVLLRMARAPKGTEKDRNHSHFHSLVFIVIYLREGRQWYRESGCGLCKVTGEQPSNRSTDFIQEILRSDQ